MRTEAIGMWKDYIGSLQDDEAEAMIEENNQLTDAILMQYGEIVDEYQMFVSTCGKIAQPYPYPTRGVAGEWM